MNLMYLAKPSYGGWISFTSHLALCKNYPIYKLTQRGEKKERPFGYGTNYINKPLEFLENLEDPILITACDKHFSKYLKYFEGESIVIHDPSELKSEVLQALPLMNVITIRKSVHDLLLAKGISNFLLPHPLYNFNYDEDIEVNKTGAISISRIDFDKNTDIIINANDILKEPIDIYGFHGDLYVYRQLGGTNFKKYYKGKFPKDFESLKNLIKNKKFVVDMSSIYKDGGGSQYTFLEAIMMNCCLVLYEKWVEGQETKFLHNHNCIIVKDYHDLAKVIESDIDTTEICRNARELLKEHLNTELW